MSTMKELYLKVAADESLQQKVNKIFEAAGEDADIAGKKLVEFAKEQGYDVTVEEIGEFFKTMSEGTDGQLSDEDLDAVAGGKQQRPGGPGGPGFGPISMGVSFGGCGVTSIVCFKW